MIRKGSVITVNNTPLLSVVYVIISVSCCCSLSTLMVESHPSFISVFETFIYWAQKYNVTIYLNENTSLYLLRNPENTTWRGLLTNLSDKKRNLVRKSQSLNIAPIDKLKSSIAPNFGNPLEEEEDDIEGNVIEEDDFEIVNIKRENVNNFVKQSDEILYFTNFH